MGSEYVFLSTSIFPVVLQEKNGPKIGSEILMVRGPEYAKFLNSLQMPRTNGSELPKYL